MSSKVTKPQGKFVLAGKPLSIRCSLFFRFAILLILHNFLFGLNIVSVKYEITLKNPATTTLQAVEQIHPAKPQGEFVHTHKTNSYGD